ncbi:DUF4184 family protein [Tessaracoccus sp.]
MPFTPAHVAAVLPLRGRPHLPFAALAAGSMSPDLPYFLPRGFTVPREVTHELWSIISWDLILGLAMWLAWRWFAPVLHDVAPTIVRERWRLPEERHPASWAVGVAVIIGAATHVLWDSLTHAGHLAHSIGPLAATYPGLRGEMAGYRYLQYISGAVGLAIVLWVGYRQPVTEPGPRRHPLLGALTPVVVVGGALAAVALRVGAMHDPTDRRALVFLSVTSSISGAAVALLSVCAVHALLGRRESVPQR